MHTQNNFENAARRHFSKQFKDQGNNYIFSQLMVIEHFLAYFSSKEGLAIGPYVSIKEIEYVLNQFAKDKSPGPHGWFVEFLLAFFNLMGVEIL